MATTNPDRWALLSNLLGDVLEAPPDQQDRLIDAACADDETLRTEFLELLEAYREADKVA